MSLEGIVRFALSAIGRRGRMLKPGQPAPDFDTADHLGRPIRLRDLRGKRVVLWFFPKADTPGWTAEGLGFRDRYEEYRKLGTEIIGVSFDTPDASRAFADKQGFPFPLIPDSDRNLGLAYGAARSVADEYAQRIAYLIDAEGRIEQVHPNVNPRAYPAEQLSYLIAIGWSS